MDLDIIISDILLTRSTTVVCSASFSRSSFTTIRKASSRERSIGRPGFADSVTALNRCGICFPVLKLVLQTWWYKASTANRSLAYSKRPRTACAQLSLTPLSSHARLQSSARIHVSLAILPNALPPYAAKIHKTVSIHSHCDLPFTKSAKLN